jgi:hypothetical protein
MFDYVIPYVAYPSRKIAETHEAEEKHISESTFTELNELNKFLFVDHDE